MRHQIKNSYSYKFSLLISSFKFLVLGIVTFILMFFIVLFPEDTTHVDNVIVGAGVLSATGIFLYGAVKGIVAIPITIYRLVKADQPVVHEYTEVTKVEPVSIKPELTDTDKKILFLEFEKECIRLQAKRFRTLEQ